MVKTLLISLYYSFNLNKLLVIPLIKYFQLLYIYLAILNIYINNLKKYIILKYCNLHLSYLKLNMTINNNLNSPLKYY